MSNYFRFWSVVLEEMSFNELSDDERQTSDEEQSQKHTLEKFVL